MKHEDIIILIFASLLVVLLLWFLTDNLIPEPSGEVIEALRNGSGMYLI